MHLSHHLIHLAFAALLALAPITGAAAVQRVASVEGVSEYRVANGLRILLVPDSSVATVTVHITYLVGSRHESYGEKGMAHLLEHLLFKGTPRFPNVKEELIRRGARWNGTTAYDRTNYYETLPAGEQNLAWALSMEADRMRNAFIRKADLDSEMTVVRNEFESGENSPGSILRQRMAQLAYLWHNYGKPVIGARADLENVSIERLRAFYRTYYQPDNAVLIVGGKFDTGKALALIEQHFSAIPRPARAIPALYTAEPTQDGERSVVLRRSGDTPLVAVLYRVPAGGHADYPAIDVLVHLLSRPAVGRLHRALVQPGKASFIWGAERALHDPGFIYFGAGLLKESPLEPARDTLLQTLENPPREPVRADEVERARTALLNDIEKIQIDSRALVGALSEFSAMGDWRAFYLYRDRLRKVGVEDVQRVAQAYLKPANRVLGVFLPTTQPDRAEIPPAPDLAKLLAGYASEETLVAGEVFDASPQNIEARVIRKTLANGMRVALLPKKTRGGNVVASLALYWGDENSKMNRGTACSLAGSMLMRGSRKHSRAELQDAFDRLKASVSVSGEGASLETQRSQLDDTLRLVAEVLKEPAFPESEFAELKRASLARVESRRSDPDAIVGERIARHLSPYPRGHWFYTRTVDEQAAELKAATLEDARGCYDDFFGATRADVAAVGDFDPDALTRLLEELFGNWKTPKPFVRIPSRFFDQPAKGERILTPDKANAVLRAGLNLELRDDHPDFPALVLSNHLLGGSSSARLAQRIREREGLSYSTYSWFSAPALDAAASFGASAIFAPQNRRRIESALREELERAVRDGFSAEEVGAAKKALLESRRVARTQDRTLAGQLRYYLFIKRTLAWDIEFEKRIAALTPAQVHDALRRHLDISRLTVIMVGDFKD